MISRSTPALLGLFSLVTLWADRIKGEHGVLPDRWYPKANPTFSDALALVPLELWTSPTCHRITGRAQKYRQAHQSPDPRRLQSSLILQSPAEKGLTE